MLAKQLKPLCVIFCLFLCSTHLRAQSDWLDGFVVLPGNDTITGKVGYFTNELQFEKCLFKESKSIKQYSSSDITSYGINGIKTYVSGVVEGQFVQAVAMGPLSLYKQGKTFFVKTENQEVYSLSSKVRTTKKDGDEYVSEDKKWKSVLYGMVSSCGANAEDFKSLSFNQKNILEEIEKYNQCKGEVTKRPKTPEGKKTLIDFGVIVGTRNNELNLSSTDGDSEPENANHKSTNLLFGGFANFRFPTISEKVSLQVGVSFQSITLSGSTRFSNADNPFRTSLIISNYEILSEFTSLSIPVSFKVILVDKSVSIYFQSGIIYNQYLNTSSSIVRERTIDGVPAPRFEENDIFEYKESQTNLWWRLGIEKSFLGKFRVGFAYDFVFLNEAILLNRDKFSPFKQSGLSVLLSF